MKTKTIPVITFCVGVLCGMGVLAMTGPSLPGNVAHSSLTPALSLSAGDREQVYTNIRYGFELAYPQTLLHPQGESVNGDGQTFVSADGKARVQVYGANLLNEEQLEELYQRAAEDDLYSQNAKLVTDKEMGDNWFSVAGYTEGDKVFYRKSIIHDGTLVTFTISYPEDEKSQWESAVSMLDSSFAVRDVRF
ncbi:MAG: hypothetical protein CMI02_09330 [Oceanospirillaceae bacterium]|nr:hypothetical protein [Oceanospirillaceae bacterium]MBT12225.1 hypothetical protein [Oceanospirillaceae bacterium]|tara:strand:+ start:7857 stop:8432 length:576 start_codon:yes stop_codon:yes gene_type:complete